ncbi:uroporphyrinogen-III C-methyltransferase [Candidatus Magnetoovum chiemensis]|nr:uroporphyrinogen-III C-methyltransferase [Candidatus Magnetoovum chiemensis]
MKSINSSKVYGKVYIVGAGPGDIGLLTLKGLSCLKRSEVVVYDFHLNAQILNLINHDAEFIYAGKRGGHHDMTQDDINAALVAKAKEGKIVCRLKGGDPFVFGRGGEEAQVLVQHGIDFEIVPGISSAIAVPAYAGIPLTHRKLSSSFAVITGNEDVTKENSAINWNAIAKSFDTLVFLMGVKNIESITGKLLENGKPENTPAALIRWGTRADQVTITSTLKDISSVVKEEHIRPPAVMVVGEVVKLRDELNWYEKKPLFGHRIIITRRYSDEYAILEELGAEILEFPTIETVAPDSYAELDRCIEEIETYNWLILTSINSVNCFFKRLMIRNRDIRDLKGIKICAIGPKSAEAVISRGIRIDLVPDEFNAEGLLDAFIKYYGSKDTIKGIKILLPRAKEAREVFPDRITELGAIIHTPPAYRTINPVVHSKRLERFLKDRKVSVATFTSASTFNNLRETLGDNGVKLLKRSAIAAIGPVTAKAIEKAGLSVDIIPKKATINDMVEAIIKWIIEKPLKI